jgi:hypothetical protein
VHLQRRVASQDGGQRRRAAHRDGQAFLPGPAEPLGDQMQVLGGLRVTGARSRAARGGQLSERRRDGRPAGQPEVGKRHRTAVGLPEHPARSFLGPGENVRAGVAEVLVARILRL